MFSFAFRILAGMERRFRSANWPLRICYVLLAILVIAVVGYATQVIPGFDKIKELFGRAPAEVQIIVLLSVLLIAIAAAVNSLRQTQQVEDLNAKLAIAEADRDQLQTRWDRLQIVSSHFELWKRSCQIAIPPFVPANQRKTRFITVLNLKGGVGKTTLTANLAACLSLASPPKRVLLVDVDFQGTLSDATVDKALILSKKAHDAFVHQLLLEPDPKSGLIDQLAVPMNHVPSAKVLIAREQLDNEDYRSQAKYYVDEKADPRFQFRKHLHQNEIFASYDYVFFDCPPRITVSVVNSLFCSDFVLIPTRLDKGSIESVPRTVNWLKVLGPNCPAVLLGVVVNQVSLNNQGKVTKADLQSYEYLRASLEALGEKDRLFKACVQSSTRAVGTDHGVVASVDPKNQPLFHPMVVEFVRRALK